MAFNIANALRPSSIGDDYIQAQQLKRGNALAQRDQAEQEANGLANRNYQGVVAQNMLDDNTRADAEVKQKETHAFLTNGVERVRQNPGLIGEFIAVGKQRGYIPPEVPDDGGGPQGIETLAMHLGLAPPEQFAGSIEEQKLMAEQGGRTDLENLRYQHDRSVAGMGAGSKPQLVDVQMPDGSTQKQWLTPGQGNGTNVGAPKPALPKPRSLSQKSIDSLGGAGEGVVNFTRLTGTFKDEFGGKGLAVIGNAENAVRRNLTGDSHGQADWWADYQNQKNLIRNKLFGSALTATEKTEFEKATINPGMRPELIRKNIARQQAVVERALERLSGAYEKGGYSREQIDAASGMDVFKSEQAPTAGAYADAAKEARYQAWKAKQGQQ